MSSELNIALGVVWGVVGGAVFSACCIFVFRYYRERPEEIPRPPKITVPPPHVHQQRINAYIERKFPRKQRTKPADVEDPENPDEEFDGERPDGPAGQDDRIDPESEEADVVSSYAEGAENRDPVADSNAEKSPGSESPDQLIEAEKGKRNAGRFGWLAAFKRLSRRPDAPGDVAGDDPETSTTPIITADAPQRSMSNLSQVRKPSSEGESRNGGTLDNPVLLQSSPSVPSKTDGTSQNAQDAAAVESRAAGALVPPAVSGPGPQPAPQRMTGPSLFSSSASAAQPAPPNASSAPLLQSTVPTPQPVPTRAPGTQLSPPTASGQSQPFAVGDWSTRNPSPLSAESNSSPLPSPNAAASLSKPSTGNIPPPRPTPIGNMSYMNSVGDTDVELAPIAKD